MLCSLESSTSHADPDLAFLDNVIEKRKLHELLAHQLHNRGGSCLDIGAGYGRFVPVFQDYFARIVLLEAAERIFKARCHLGPVYGH
jgi:ubiquinone/menaquinone biosynthesis C-methylase UbiE